jgi:hypothetical protein
VSLASAKEYELVEKGEVQLIDVNQTNHRHLGRGSDEQTLSWTATHYGQKLNSLDSFAYTACTSRIRHYFIAQ